jgi:prepilin-type N-terminal cleavage/methylation domain-containing protein
MKKVYSPGFTLIELLVSITIISVFFIPVFITYSTSRANQALRTTANSLADNINSARIFARSAKDEKAWGIIRGSNTNYTISSKNPDGTSPAEVYNYSLETGLVIEPFNPIWFKAGTGELEEGSATSVQLKTTGGKLANISISQSGIVEVVIP